MTQGYLAAFGFVFLLIIGIYCFGYAARRTSLLYVLLLETILGLVILLPILSLNEDLGLREILTKPSWSHYLWLATASLLGFAGGNYISLLNLKLAGERINSLLSPTITALTILLSFFVFSEMLLLKQWLGVLLTISVITLFLLYIKIKPEIDTPITSTGWWSCIATILCISLSIICSIKGASESLSFLHAITIRLLFAFLIITLVFIITHTYKKIKKN